MCYAMHAKTRMAHPTRQHLPFAGRALTCLTLDRYRSVRSERRRSRNALKSRNEKPSQPPMKHRHFKCPKWDVLHPRGRGNPICGRSSIESRGTKTQKLYTDHYLLLPSEYLTKVVPDDTWRLSSVDSVPKTFVLVILDHGASLAVESGEALSESFDIVVRTLDEGLPRDIVDH